jgi:Dr family adhesin
MKKLALLTAALTMVAVGGAQAVAAAPAGCCSWTRR